ncbi:thioredoxin family protein [Leptospira sp. GIMC2001]|uniref:thioredoxin family protein n=1 Tax=Leptospira sp. GIMC2001 TaxID=1513297 RepID=UPI002349034E|nr:thioredoxin family protein [Leptospira sp. GIMC2001]WCL49691.1 thioredoxin family protein [Leptospira sp. GIMC2001]
MIKNTFGFIIFAFFIMAGLVSCADSLNEDKKTEQLYYETIPIAKASGQLVLVVFGADWCADCNSLKNRFYNNSDIRTLLEKEYLVFHVDVGRFDKNLIFAERFGSPEKKGIPALVIVDPSQEEKVLATTMGGEFSSAQQMQDKEILNYLKQFIAKK